MHGEALLGPWAESSDCAHLFTLPQMITVVDQSQTEPDLPVDIPLWLAYGMVQRCSVCGFMIIAWKEF